jgi:hypothetical protein
MTTSIHMLSGSLFSNYTNEDVVLIFLSPWHLMGMMKSVSRPVLKTRALWIAPTYRTRRSQHTVTEVYLN